MPVMAIQPSSKMVRMAIWFLIAETMDEDLLVSQMADKIVFALESDLESMHQVFVRPGENSTLKPRNPRSLEKALGSHRRSFKCCG
ncbi:MAG: hypothetical protein ACLUP5_06945 [Streptococcus sp.]